MSIAEYGNTPINPICLRRSARNSVENRFNGLQQDPDSMHACPRAHIRASPRPVMSVVALRYCSSSGFSRFQPGICLTQPKISIADIASTDGFHTELTRDTTDTTRHEPAEPADLTNILNVVPVLCEHPFLLPCLVSTVRVRGGEHLTEDSYDRNLMADSGRIFATDSPFPIQKPSTPFSTYILVTALDIAFIPNDLDTAVRAGSGCRVIRNIFNRSNGAVNVRETGDQLIRE